MRGVEGYRARHGILDSHNAIGARPEDRAHQHDWEEQRRALQAAPRTLELRHAAERSTGMEIRL